MFSRLISRKDLRHLGRAARHPGRAVLRLALRAQLGRLDAAEERRRLLAYLSSHFGVDGPALGREYARSEFSGWFEARRSELERFRGPHRLGTTGSFGCEALYLLVRAARPGVVVDTGVLYGASSSHILAALERNGGGTLHSIELGRNEHEPPHHFFVPAELRRRWTLTIGDSRRELPRLLDRLGTIDMFHHDSLHTRAHMTWEFETAYPHIRPQGLLASDDIHGAATLRELFRANAFPVFCGRRGIEYDTFFTIGVGTVTPSRGRLASRLKAG